MLTPLLISMLMLTFNIQPVKAGTITVPDDYPTIQEAINHANEGDTIYVKAGTYYENVVVDKSVSLIGQNRINTIIYGCGHSEHVVSITASNVTIANFTITNSICGIFLWENCSYSNIFGNRITNNLFAVNLLYSSSNYIFGNTIMTNESERALEGSGINLTCSSNNNIFQNSIQNGGSGICVACCSDYNNIYENNITDNDFGIQLYNSSNNCIYHNNFINNLEQTIVNYANVWDDGYPSGGNYWSDYNGTDLYSGPNQNMTGSDGIGDTPYIIDSNNIDHYPLMLPWGTTKRKDVAISDEFGGTVLNPAWIWLDPLRDCNYNLTANPGHLRIFVPGDGHDLYPGANYNAPRVIQLASGDFVIETRVLFDPQHDAQGAGILIWKDSDNYLRLDRLFHIGGQVVDLSGKKAGTWFPNAQTPYLLTETYLRLERTADTFTAKYSEDGIDWITLGNISFPFVDPVCIGLFVIDQWQNNPIYADFDYFRVGISSRINRLTAYIMNSNSLPVDNASVNVAHITTYTNSSGYALFDLPFGTYNVTASHQDYKSESWIVDLDRDKNITLTLSYPYVFEGEIANSNIILTPVQSGYNITILNNLTSSDMDIFFDWKNMGTIPPGTWQVFNFDHMPNLVVEAASKGSSDYPKSWYKHPLPIQLTPTTGNEGAFPPEPIPYVTGSIFVNPYPPVYGQNTTIGVTLHNPYNHTLNISRIDFQISGLTVGGYFTSVGYISDISLQDNETRVLSIKWNATASGHHCIRVVLTYSPATQAMQRNIDVENDVIEGGTGEVSFSLVNPFETSKVMTVKVNKQLASGSEAMLEIDGRVYDTSSDIVIEVAPGQELHAILRIVTSTIALEDGVVDIEAYVNGQLIGGVRKKIQTIPPVAGISISGPSGQPMGFEGETLLISGTGWFPDSLVRLYMQSGVHNLGSVYANKEGKFAIPCGIPGLGPVPLLVTVSAESDKQSDWKTFLYLGNADDLGKLGECWYAVLGADLVKILGDEYPKYAMRIFYAKTGAEMIYKSLTAPEVTEWDIIERVTEVLAKVLLDRSIGGLLKCGGAIITLMSRQRHHLDLIVRTANGTIGTTGSGEYVNNVNGSWASGNNFNDLQFILIPFTTSFNVTIDATRAAYDVESYNMAVAFACGRVNKTTNLPLQGEIQRGTCATYHVNLENWTISATPLHNVRVAAIASKSVVGQGYSIPLDITIANDGYYAETFNVTAYANQTIIETKAITLTSGNFTTITFTWNTSGFAKGNYTISAYAWPVQGETYTTDNTKDDGTVLVSIAGDVNGDHLVDISDLVITVNVIPSAPRWPNWNPNVDINGDGVCDVSDLVICVGNIPSSW